MVSEMEGSGPRKSSDDSHRQRSSVTRSASKTLNFRSAEDGEVEEDMAVVNENDRRLSNSDCTSTIRTDPTVERTPPHKIDSPVTPPQERTPRHFRPCGTLGSSESSRVGSPYDLFACETASTPSPSAGAGLATAKASSPTPEDGESHGYAETDVARLSTPGPGRRSKLFRRATLLTPGTPSGSDGYFDDDDDAGGDVCHEAQGPRGGDRSLDLESVAKGSDKRVEISARGGGGGGRDPRTARRREALTPDRRTQQRGCASKEAKVHGESGRVGAKTATSTSRLDSSLAASPKERQRKCLPEGGGSKKTSDRQRQQVKQRLFPKSDKAAGKTPTPAKTPIRGSGANRSGSRTPKSTKKVAPAKSPAAAVASRKIPNVKNQSAWAALPSERRQPVLKAAGTPKAKVPVVERRPTAVKGQGSSGAHAKGPVSSPTPRSIAKVPGMKGVRPPEKGKVDGDKSDVVGFWLNATKNLTPRVSSGYKWELDLRKSVKIPTKNETSPDKKGGSKRGALKGAKGMVGKSGGSGEGGRGVGSGGWGGNGGGGYGGGNGGGGGNDGADGRPSIATWNRSQEYLQILKEISGKDEEELEWLADAKRGKGIQKSERRRESAETEYHRLLCQESMQQAGLTLLRDRQVEVALRALIKMETELHILSKNSDTLEGEEKALIMLEEASLQDADDQWYRREGAVKTTAAEAEAQANVEVARAKRLEDMARVKEERGKADTALKEFMGHIEKGQERVRVARNKLAGQFKNGRDDEALTTIYGVVEGVSSSNIVDAPRKAKAGVEILESTAADLRKEIEKTRSDAQAALARMEKWRERQQALPDYERGVADKERAWFARENDANDQALRRMRALCPVGVTSFTVPQLEQRAIQAGSLYPRQLSLRLKENRLLHWTVEHPDDIARSNFLRGDHAHFFTNLDRYDLVELRAVTACLPERFEVDGDGRKATWRAAFLQRVQGLVAQERGETVSGGWDPEIGARRTVRLPELTVEQTRRPEYFYPTREEVDERMEKLRERERRLETKKAKLAEARDVLLPEAREEYTNVLEDTRHPGNKAAFSTKDLRRARDESRAEVDRLVKEVKRLEAEVAAAERALKDAPYTTESLKAEDAATRILLADRAKKRRLALAEQKQEEDGETTSASSPAAVEGVTETATDFDLVSGEEVGTAESEERVEVEGPFDPEPDLRPRFGDKSRSLKFVTAEEDARMRREELARVFSDRNAGEAGAGMRVDVAKIGGHLKLGEKDDGEECPGLAKNANAGESTAEVSGGGMNARIKTFGAAIEKTLGKKIQQSSRSVGATEAGDARGLVSSPSGPGGGAPTSAEKGAQNTRGLSPPCTPKSKFFRSIRTPTSGSGDTPARAPMRTPPTRMLGLLSQIRAQGGGKEKIQPSEGSRSGADTAKATLGEGSKVEVGGDHAAGCSVSSPMPLPPPAPPLPPRLPGKTRSAVNGGAKEAQNALFAELQLRFAGRAAML